MAAAAIRTPIINPEDDERGEHVPHSQQVNAPSQNENQKSAMGEKQQEAAEEG